LNPADLYAALTAIPRLPGAACRGRHHLFDPADTTNPDHDNLQAQALALCRQCPALAGCTAWFESLPKRHRPSGVVAGRCIK
jgi:WhiB family transcriptional regulator, redox-sensing transcriptional regulator